MMDIDSVFYHRFGAESLSRLSAVLHRGYYKVLLSMYLSFCWLSFRDYVVCLDYQFRFCLTLNCMLDDVMFIFSPIKPCSFPLIHCSNYFHPIHSFSSRLKELIFHMSVGSSLRPTFLLMQETTTILLQSGVDTWRTCTSQSSNQNPNLLHFFKLFSGEIILDSRGRWQS